MAAAIAAVPAADVAAAVLAGGMVTVPVSGGTAFSVGPDDVIVTQTPRAGWAVATDAGETVAIDTAVTPELRRDGLAREVIRLIQEARKSDGLDVTDRIALRWSAGDGGDAGEAGDPELVAALTEHAALIAGEILAVEFGPAEAAGTAGLGSGDVREHVDEELGLRFWLRRYEQAGRGSGRGAGPGLLGGLVGLVREAGAARGAACFPGGGEGHLVQVAIAHEADEDAVGVVIPGNARDHGYLHGWVRASGFGVIGLLVLLVLLSLVAVRAGGGRGGAGDKGQLGLGNWDSFGNHVGNRRWGTSRLGFRSRLWLGSRLGLARGGGLGLVLGVSRRRLPGRNLDGGWRGVRRLVALGGRRRYGGVFGAGRCGGLRSGSGLDRVVAPLPDTGRRGLTPRGERGRGARHVGRARARLLGTGTGLG
jgi:hypothetical protein